jgi:pyridinium-3,5-bisthiocarboxylic acid mononucleotide nickel chelatase
LKTLYFDCFSGASGDMVLGALIDAGVPLDEVRRALGSLTLDPDVVWTERVVRAGIRATKFCVRGEDFPADHAHDHRHADEKDHSHHRHSDGREQDHGHADDHRRLGHVVGAPAADETVHHHVHRSLADIHKLIDRSALSAAGSSRAKTLFTTLAEVEAGIHGTSLDRVHLHEVGALDSIVDIVGAVFALEFLGVEHVVSSPLNVGGGTIRSAHGLYPVPAPATLELLRDVPIYSGQHAVELVTPTGALLVRSYAKAFGPVPAMRVHTIGYGAGTRDFPDTPNVLRVMIGEMDAAAPSQRVVVIETEIDDMNPQIFGPLMDQLIAQGALDVFYTPIQMKKNRPGTLLTAIAAPEQRERLTSTLFRETTTIGVRYREMARECLDREEVQVETPFGMVRFKVARRNGEILNVSPEFEDCVRLAAEHGRPVKEVQALASKAFFERHAGEAVQGPVVSDSHEPGS